MGFSHNSKADNSRKGATIEQCQNLLMKRQTVDGRRRSVFCPCVGVANFLCFRDSLSCKVLLHKNTLRIDYAKKLFLHFLNGKKDSVEIIELVSLPIERELLLCQTPLHL